MRTTLSEQLAACARELEITADELASQGLPNRSASSAAALMADIAERVAKAGRVEIEGDVAIAVQDADLASDHPREVLALSGKEWDFTLPGCEVFGCISGKTDAETYRESHNGLLERLRVVDDVDYGVRHQLLEEIANQWEAFDETAEARWRAADTLLGSLGVWAQDEVNDSDRYKTFAAIPGIVADLIEALNDVEYEEYCSDRGGVSKRQAQDASAKAQELADAVKAWEASDA